MLGGEALQCPASRKEPSELFFTGCFHLFVSNPALNVLHLQDKPTEFSWPGKCCFTPPPKAPQGREHKGLVIFLVGICRNTYSSKNSKMSISVSQPALS